MTATPVAVPFNAKRVATGVELLKSTKVTALACPTAAESPFGLTLTLVGVADRGTVVSMGVLTWKGATAKEALGSELVLLVPSWAKQQGFTHNEKAVKGATLFAQSGCLNCHTYLGQGAGQLGAPNLSAIGKANNAAFFVQYLTNPAAFGNKVMISYAYLGTANLSNIAAFLAASDGPK